MAGVTDDIYKQIADAKASAGGTALRDGEGLIVVRKLLVEKKHKGIMFIAEGKVLEANAVDVPDEFRTLAEFETGADGIKRQKLITPNKAGTDASYVVNLGKESGPGNAKAFLLGIDGTPESEIDPEKFMAMIKRVTSQEQPFRGALLRFKSFRKLIQKGANAGKPFTAFAWVHVPQQIAEMQARAAQLDADDKQAT